MMWKDFRYTKVLCYYAEMVPAVGNRSEGKVEALENTVGLWPIDLKETNFYECRDWPFLDRKR